jgi:hypothetical protein
METIPNEVEKLNQEIKECSGVFDILDGFN